MSYVGYGIEPFDFGDAEHKFYLIDKPDFIKDIDDEKIVVGSDNDYATIGDVFERFCSEIDVLLVDNGKTGWYTKDLFFTKNLQML